MNALTLIARNKGAMNDHQVVPHAASGVPGRRQRGSAKGGETANENNRLFLLFFSKRW